MWGRGLTSKKANLTRLRGNTAIWSVNELCILILVRATPCDQYFTTPGRAFEKWSWSWFKSVEQTDLILELYKTPAEYLHYYLLVFMIRLLRRTLAFEERLLAYFLVQAAASDATLPKTMPSSSESLLMMNVWWLVVRVWAQACY